MRVYTLSEGFERLLLDLPLDLFVVSLFEVALRSSELKFMKADFKWKFRMSIIGEFI